MTLRGTAGWLSLFSLLGDDVTGKLELLSFLGDDGGGDDAFPFSFLGEDAAVLLLPLLDAAALRFSLLGEDATRESPLFSLQGDTVKRDSSFFSVSGSDVLAFLSLLGGDVTGEPELSSLLGSDVFTELSLACFGGDGTRLSFSSALLNVTAEALGDDVTVQASGWVTLVVVLEEEREGMEEEAEVLVMVIMPS